MDESLEAGGSWARQIEREIKRCDLFVVLISPDVNREQTSIQDGSFVLNEIQYAKYQYRKPILPVMAQKTDMPVEIVDIQYIDITKDREKGIEKIIEDVCKRAGIDTPFQIQMRKQQAEIDHQKKIEEEQRLKAEAARRSEQDRIAREKREETARLQAFAEEQKRLKAESVKAAEHELKNQKQKPVLLDPLGFKRISYIPNLTPLSGWGIFFGVVILVIIGLVVAGVPKDFRSDEGILDTDAVLMSDLSLLAYVLLIVPSMVIGYRFARSKKFVPHHQVVMTGVMLFNWALIAFIMAVTYDGLQEFRSEDSVAGDFRLASLHMVIALSAQLLGTYLVIRMWFEDVLPAWAKVKKIKRYMRLTLAGWLIAAALGAATYIQIYDLPGSGGSSMLPLPLQTPEVTDEPSNTTDNNVPDSTPEATPEVNETPESTN